MNVWANTVITEKGLALLAKLAQGNTLDIVEAVTGTGWVTPGLLQKQTGVTNPKTTMAFRPVSYPENGACSMPVTMTNDGLDIGYEATQVGVFATDPDEGKILFLIAQSVTADKGTTVPSETEMPGYSAEWTFLFKYGQADGVNVTVNPANTVSRAEMEEYCEHHLAQVLEDYTPTEDLSNMYVWKKYSGAPRDYAETENVEVFLGNSTNALDEGAILGSVSVTYADDFYVARWKIYLESPQTTVIRYFHEISVLAGKYVQVGDKVYYIDPKATLYQQQALAGYRVYASPATKIEPYQFLHYVTAKESDVYPNPNGYEKSEDPETGETIYGDCYYEYLGQLGDRLESNYTYGTEDLEAGVSKLETGKLYFVYE